MQRNRSKFLPAALVTLTAFTTLAADTSGPELKPSAVAIFKNGLAFMVRAGSVKLSSGEATLSFVPAATLGSLWIAPNDKGASLDEVVAYRYEEKSLQPILSVEDLLLANAGKTVAVTYDQHQYTGEIVALRTGQNRPPQDEPVPGAQLDAQRFANPAPQYVLLKSEGKLLSLSLGLLNNVTLPPDATYQTERSEWKKGLRLRVKGASDHAGLTMGYLEKGIGWTPSYLVSLKDDKAAEITLQSVVTNDAEDIRDADVFFVVGVPNFAYADIPSPMALEGPLTGLMELESQGLASKTDRFNNSLTGQFQAGVAVNIRDDAAANFSTTVQELAGAPEEDLFLYTHAASTLRRGERATYNVFSAPISFEHIYEWDVTDTSRVDANGVLQNYNSSSQDRPTREIVWHSLRMKNSTKFPWTSGPALVISGTKPIAQDTLPYTPKGSTSNLKLTIATDIRASQQEIETDRQRNTPHPPPHTYDLVTVDGTLKLENYKSTDVHLTIRKSLRGEVISASDDAKPEKTAHGITADNPSSLITWDLTLKAAEKKSLTYRYKILVRH